MNWQHHNCFVFYLELIFRWLFLRVATLARSQPKLPRGWMHPRLAAATFPDCAFRRIFDFVSGI